MQRIKSKSECKSSIQPLNARKEIEEFARWRWYETYWDYQYRVRNIPHTFFSLGVKLNGHLDHYWGEDDLLQFIRLTRIESIKELASKAFLNNVYSETISAEDLNFDMRRGKNYKTGWRKICFGNEQLEHLFYNTEWCYSTEFKTINAN